jgi:hypothetical protein
MQAGESGIRIKDKLWVIQLSLVIGHWQLVIGHWSFASFNSHWALVIRHWSLAARHSIVIHGHSVVGLSRCPVVGFFIPTP